MKYEDACKNEIRVGDYIIYSAQVGRSAVLKFGNVVELSTTKSAYVMTEKTALLPTLKVVTVNPNYYKGPQLQNHGFPITLSMLDRVCVVLSGTFSSDVMRLFDEAKPDGDR